MKMKQLTGAFHLDAQTTSKLSEKDAFYEERSYPNTISKNLSKPGRTTSFWNGLYSESTN